MAGFKVWTTGDLVNASDFNNYLQEQVIGRFDSSSARDSQISSPEEGMFAFLKDTNTLTFYNGSSWLDLADSGSVTNINSLSDAANNTTDFNLFLGHNGGIYATTKNTFNPIANSN